MGATVAWVSLVAAGFVLLWRYASAPGAEGHVPLDWPSASTLTRAADRAQMLVFVHPRCTCSRATIAELGKTLARVPDKVATTVVSAFKVSMQSRPGPTQPPPEYPEKNEPPPLTVRACTVNAVPPAKSPAQIAPLQLNPEGTVLTVPLVVPALTTVSV